MWKTARQHCELESLHPPVTATGHHHPFVCVCVCVTPGGTHESHTRATLINNDIPYAQNHETIK